MKNIPSIIPKIKVQYSPCLSSQSIISDEASENSTINNEETNTINLKNAPKESATIIPDALKELVNAGECIPNCSITKKTVTINPRIDKQGSIFLFLCQIKSKRTINTKVIEITISGFKYTRSCNNVSKFNLNSYNIFKNRSVN